LVNPGNEIDIAEPGLVLTDNWKEDIGKIESYGGYTQFTPGPLFLEK
jgi:hypothetical protein